MESRVLEGGLCLCSRTCPQIVATMTVSLRGYSSVSGQSRSMTRIISGRKLVSVGRPLAKLALGAGKRVRICSKEI